MDDLKIENFYSKIKGNEGKDDTHDYKLYDKMLIPTNSRMLIVGKSGSGKTNIVMDLIKKIGFDTLLLVIRDETEPLYKYLIEKLQKLEKKIKENILTVIHDPSEMPNIDTFDKKKKNCIIFDDQIVSPNMKNVAECFIRGRKKNILTIFITQSFFDTNKLVRKNLDFIILKSMSGKNDIKRILSEYNLNDLSADEVLELYKRIVKEDFTNFLMIDLKNQDVNKKYRWNYSGIPIEE